MATSVNELDLPEVDIFGLDRMEAIARFDAVRGQHWLARMPFGYTVMDYADVVANLRDRRFHSALSVMPQMMGTEDLLDRGDRPSILSMEGPEHSRLRRLVAPAFTPKGADRLRPFMREVINGLLDPYTPTGRCELVADV
jgi:cytochrome P450